MPNLDPISGVVWHFKWRNVYFWRSLKCLMNFDWSNVSEGRNPRWERRKRRKQQEGLEPYWILWNLLVVQVSPVSAHRWWAAKVEMSNGIGILACRFSVDNFLRSIFFVLKSWHEGQSENCFLNFLLLLVHLILFLSSQAGSADVRKWWNFTNNSSKQMRMLLITKQNTHHCSNWKFTPTLLIFGPGWSENESSGPGV